MSTTAGRWLHLPTALGADDRLELDAPAGSDVLSTIASNATHAARQNNLSTLWEHPGGDVWQNLSGGTDPADFLVWSGEDGSGYFARYCGAHRVRRYGETTGLPTVELRARIKAPSTFVTGLVLVARATYGRPSAADLYAYTSTSSTSLTAATVSLAPTLAHIGHEAIGCRTPGTTAAPDEDGDLPLLHLWVGAWCTSASGAAKGAISGLTLFLKAPS